MRRAAPVLIVAAALALVALGIVWGFIGGEELGDETESPGSIGNTDLAGTSGWFGTLRDLGYDVREWRDAFDAELPDAGTLVVVSAPDISSDEVDAVVGWLRSGAGDRRLVIVDPQPGAGAGLLAAALPGAAVDTQALFARPETAVPAPENAGLPSLAADTNAFIEADDAAPVYALDGDPDHAYAVRSENRAGNLTLAVADAQTVVNQGIIEGNNAAFAVALAGADTDRPVYFDQFHHRPHERGGPLSFLDWKVQLFVFQIIFAGVVLAFAVGVQFGGTLPEPETPPRRRIEYVDAVGRAYKDSGGAAYAAELIRSDLRDELRRRLRVGADAGDHDLVQGAERIGIAPELVGRVLLAPAGDDLGFTELARAAAEIRRAVERGESLGTESGAAAVVDDQGVQADGTS